MPTFVAWAVVSALAFDLVDARVFGWGSGMLFPWVTVLQSSCWTLALYTSMRVGRHASRSGRAGTQQQQPH